MKYSINSCLTKRVLKTLFTRVHEKEHIIDENCSSDGKLDHISHCAVDSTISIKKKKYVVFNKLLYNNNSIDYTVSQRAYNTL